MSEKTTLMGMLQEFSGNVQILIGEIQGQKERFQKLADQVGEQLSTAAQYVRDMAASLKKAQEAEGNAGTYAGSSQSHSQASERHSNSSAESAYESAQSLAECKSVQTQVGNQVSVASEFAEESRQHSQEAALQKDASAEHADRSERAKDESYLAVSELAADIQEIKVTIAKQDGLA